MRKGAAARFPFRRLIIPAERGFQTRENGYGYPEAEQRAPYVSADE